MAISKKQLQSPAIHQPGIECSYLLLLVQLLPWALGRTILGGSKDVVVVLPPPRWRRRQEGAGGLVAETSFHLLPFFFPANFPIRRI
ncbi:hypothetical protein GDO81_018922 [Engystomops pustulosus]|uniref:Uncharacterized protein n=1 Tax=Engystomops pustulosus TaxID=76066 RepID=A0AAV6ZB59_ENGPU|nr:hypothetical protein GDO81_018922 [Engystomops pustulosus]